MLILTYTDQRPYSMQNSLTVLVSFLGGPAPAANAVISAAAVSFLEEGIEVLGFFHGYSNLASYDPETNPLLADKHYRIFDNADMRGLRNERGICIGTARTNPGKGITQPADLSDPAKTAKLRQVYEGLKSLGVDALISIGGDDTLKPATFFQISSISSRGYAENSSSSSSEDHR